MRTALCAVVVVAGGCSFDDGGVAIDRDAATVEGPDGGPSVIDAGASAGDEMDATVDAAPDAGVACPPGYVPLGDSGTRYRLDNGPDDWDDAERDCENDGEGTHLVVIDSADELAQVSELAEEGKVWIGVTSRAGEDVWVTVLGATPAVLPWRRGAPEHDDDGLCVSLISEDARFDDSRCYRRKRYVCECDGREPDASAY